MTRSTRRGGPTAGVLLRAPGGQSLRSFPGRSRVTCEVQSVAAITSGHCALHFLHLRIQAPDRAVVTSVTLSL
jgi:hypothetical protein